jgi:hypothetical protein
MASSQGTQPQHPLLAIHSADKQNMIYSFSNTISYPHFTLFFFFSDKIMTDVASKQHILSTIITRTRRHTELTKKIDKPDGNPLLYQETFSSVFRADFLHS